MGLLATANDGGGGEADAAAARAVALHWTGAETADAPRWDGDGWEVDVRRPNGSVVEVELDESFRVRNIDEEDVDDE